MKLTFLNVLKLSIAVGAGLEIGKALPEALSYALNKKNRAHYRRVYRQGVADYERKQKTNIRVVPDQPVETPTGD
ncbi:hypothetical protein SEA_HOTFRIES_32 [Streptomyces phage HotFries]|nr:hypothetical protein SEA_HOTFRIES_32 [Streptomyces phage HotFries]